MPRRFQRGFRPMGGGYAGRMVIHVRLGCAACTLPPATVISRMGVLAAQDRGSSRAERVLREAFPRLGFPVRAIQIDGGSEFQASRA